MSTEDRSPTASRTTSRTANRPANRPANETIEEYFIDEDEGRGGCRSCLWGLAGMAGCGLLLVGIVAGLVLLGVNTVDGIVGGVARIFNPPQRTTGVFVPVVDRVQQLSELATRRYNYANIVTSESDMPDLLRALYGEQMVMVAVGHIEAGVDLRELSAEDITYDEASDTLTLRLPPPVLQDCFLNEIETYTVSRSQGLFTAPSPDLDAQSRRFALRQFRDQALEEGILEDAREQARTIVEEFAALFVGNLVAPPQIEVIVAPPDPNAPLPNTCQ